MSSTIPNSGVHCLETTLWVHIFNVKAHDCDVIPSQINTLELVLEGKRVLECVLFKWYVGTPEGFLNGF